MNNNVTEDSFLMKYDKWLTERAVAQCVEYTKNITASKNRSLITVNVSDINRIERIISIIDEVAENFPAFTHALHARLVIEGIPHKEPPALKLESDEEALKIIFSMSEPMQANVYFLLNKQGMTIQKAEAIRRKG